MKGEKLRSFLWFLAGSPELRTVDGLSELSILAGLRVCLLVFYKPSSCKYLHFPGEVRGGV